MFRINVGIFLCLTVLAEHLVAQRFKLYKDFDSESNVDRFNNNKEGISYRLPNNTYPLRFDIELTTKIDQAIFTFSGTVRILLQAKEDTNSITLHSKMNRIISATLLGPSDNIITTQQPQLDPVTEFLVINIVGTPLVAENNYTLVIAYDGELRSAQEAEGFYRSSYLSETGETVWLAATQFQESDARHGFPCYDEPAVRSIFNIRITHSRTYQALSNMPVAQTVNTLDPLTVTTIFQDTPPMQAYLIAIVISDFTFISNSATMQPSELLQSVYGQPSAIANGEADFALDAGIKIMHKMEDYFGVPYSLPKMDQIALPDLSAGAMENWGLVTYQELYLYFNNGTSPFQQLDWVASIISHEFAHQWFGNLISPKWWDVLWLNEGFASMYEYLSTDAVYPDWRMHDMMVVNTLQTVMERDAFESTRPMTHYVESRADVRNLFDFVAYSKSGCVLRMIQHALTDETFVRGLNYYIQEMQYQSAEPDDLYRNLQQAAREDLAIPATVTIKEIMDSWANQKGFPMLYVTRSDAGVVTVTQERFLLQRQPESVDLSWWIPYNFAVQNNPNFNQTTPDGWMQQGTNSITLTPSSAQTWTNDEWIIFNKQQSGYYRVNYDATLWQLIIAELVEGNYTNIHVLNRAQLIDDIYTFARVNQVPYSTVFGLMEYLSNELDYAPWAPANRALNTIDRHMASLESYDQFKTFVHHKVQPLFDSLGVHNQANDTYFDRLARNVAIGWACYVGSPECLAATNNRLKEVISTGQVIEADLRYTVLCNGLRQADENDFLAIWIIMTSNTQQADRNMMIDALGCSQNTDLLRTLLETTILVVDVNYSNTERTRILNSVVQGGIVGVRVVLQFLDLNFMQTITRFSVVSVVNNLARWIGNEELVTEFEDLTNRLLIAGQITLEQRNNFVAVARSNLQWASDYGTDITEWLDLYNDRTTDGSSVHMLSVILLMFTVMLSAVSLI